MLAAWFALLDHEVRDMSNKADMVTPALPSPPLAFGLLQSQSLPRPSTGAEKIEKLAQLHNVRFTYTAVIARFSNVKL